MKTTWVRWRHEWSCAPGIWTYLKLFGELSPAEIESIIEERCCLQNVDGYRGTSYQVIKSPPKEFFVEEIKRIEEDVAYWKSVVARYKDYLNAL